MCVHGGKAVLPAPTSAGSHEYKPEPPASESRARQSMMPRPETGTGIHSLPLRACIPGQAAGTCDSRVAPGELHSHAGVNGYFQEHPEIALKVPDWSQGFGFSPKRLPRDHRHYATMGESKRTEDPFIPRAASSLPSDQVVEAPELAKNRGAGDPRSVMDREPEPETQRCLRRTSPFLTRVGSTRIWEERPWRIFECDGSGC